MGYLRSQSPNILELASIWKRVLRILSFEYMAAITAIYVFIGMWFVIGLTVFHWFLVFVGKTTNEQLRNLHPAGSPFKRSLIGNIIDNCCKLPPSSIDLHHAMPTLNENEFVINKQKIVLLNDECVERHQSMKRSHIGEDGKNEKKVEEDDEDEEEENKYDECSESKTNEKSKSRKDENANQDELYSYDEDEEEDEEAKNENVCSMTPQPNGNNLSVQMTKVEKSQSSPNI